MVCSRPRSIVLWFAILGALAAGCGGGGGGDGVNAELLKSGPVAESVTAAEKVSVAEFPKSEGKTLEQLLQDASSQAQLAPGNGTLTVGPSRLAFAAIGQDGKPVYGPTVVYVAPSPGEAAVGPFAAPADPMVPQQKFLSKQAALSGDELQAVYATTVPFPKAGKWSALSFTKTPDGLVAATTSEIPVRKSSSIPAVGQTAPKATTLTNSSTGPGPIDTRDPKAPSLHEQSFDSVVGKKPVAILFASPKFCISRVCGPVTDLLLQLQAAYGDEVAMIQQEAYSPKYPAPAPSMKQFGLVATDGGFSEPWFFTVGTDGKIAGRLEGAFGINEMSRAIDSAIAAKK
ncbi:MAG: hypothetical protein WCO96_00330 [Actinomycetes bacterium]